MCVQTRGANLGEGSYRQRNGREQRAEWDALVGADVCAADSGAGRVCRGAGLRVRRGGGVRAGGCRGGRVKGRGVCATGRGPGADDRAVAACRGVGGGHEVGASDAAAVVVVQDEATVANESGGAGRQGEVIVGVPGNLLVTLVEPRCVTSS